ncbi:MAG: glycoside hydrolase family 2 protein [Bacteroidia bacterium]|nr:glycoside hydrolase family 2 protein [Bacteroidia bacterium]
MKIKLFILFTLFSKISLAQESKNYLANFSWQLQSSKTYKTSIPAYVPSNVHGVLLTNKLIDNPLIENNLAKLDWIEKEEWIYSTQFTITEPDLNSFSNLTLSIESIDTYSDIFLNDQLISSSKSQFVPINLEVKKQVKIGTNTLKVILKPSKEIAKNLSKKYSYTFPGEDRVFSRKAPFSFGWDFAPELPAFGISEPKLIPWNLAKINHVRCKQFVNKDSSVTLQWYLEIEANEDATTELNYGTTSHSVQESVKKKIKLQKGIHTYEVSSTLKKPLWWYSNGFGSAHLYSYQFKLMHQKQMLSTWEEKIGIRTIEWIRENDEAGQSFYLKLNGKPVFIKGANWVPPNIFTSEISTEDYRNLLVKAADVNMNMVRIWGGGIYPSKEFYNLCDSLGILVWQDFMFACAMYPADSLFLDLVKEEIDVQIKKFQNHPSLAIWCGNNENAEGWHNWGWQKQYNYSFQDSSAIAHAYYALFDSLIPERLSHLQSNTFYWSSSPSIGWGKPESLKRGDLHYWGIWWGNEPFENYRNKVGRFVSEYGFQSFPNYSTCEKIGIIKNAVVDSAIARFHQKHPIGFETINHYLKQNYPAAKNIEQFVYLSQLLQARGMEIAIESHRAAKPYCMGTLFWQLNDAWPGITWSSIDYYGKKKAFYYKLKSSYAPYFIAVKHIHDSLEIKVISDAPQSISGAIQFVHWNKNGNALDQQIKSINIPENSATTHRFAINKELNMKDTCEWVIQVNLLNGGENIAQKNFYFCLPQNLKLAKESYILEMVDERSFTIYSEVPMKDIYIQCKDFDFETDINYFDLMPYQKQLIQVKSKNNVKFERKDFNIISFNSLLN